MRIVLIVSILICSLNAFYNPFFVEDKPKDIQQQREVIQKVIVKPKPIPARKSVNMTYFGYVNGNAGKYALISFNGKNIVVTQNDSLYNNEDIFKIFKINSNYIVVKDRQGRAETVYFSSEEK